MLDFHTPKYDGPLDLLLALIQKNEVSIYDIPISLITEQFLSYIKEAENVGLNDLSDFYKMAADLIWIKSQMMLPKEVEFGEDYSDPREELIERLIEYSKFKKYSELLYKVDDENQFIPKRKFSEFNFPVSDLELIKDADIFSLASIFLNLLKQNYPNEKIFNVYEDVTEKEKITLMNELLERNHVIKFSDLFINHSSPSHIICSFLAVLSGVKDKLIIVSQPELFGDMTIEKRPPDYNPNKADDYDSDYDEIVDNRLQDADSFSVMSDSD